MNVLSPSNLSITVGKKDYSKTGNVGHNFGILSNYVKSSAFHLVIIFSVPFVLGKFFFANRFLFILN